MSTCYAVRADQCFATGPAYISGSTIPQLLDELARTMRANPDAVAKANAVYEVTVYGHGTVTIDTTVRGGRITEGPAPNADCTFALSEETLKRLMDRSLTPELAVLTGRLRVSDVPAAMRLGEIIRRVMRSPPGLYGDDE